LCWIAAATSRIRVASRVLAVPYRNPAVVAKMAESLHRLSRGRLILGLGGGYSDDEFRAFGLGTPTPREKVDGLEDAVRIARGLWTGDEVTFDGMVHHTARARIEPKPAGKIPIWLGTYGRRALDVTGRLADGWIPSFGFAPPEQVAVMIERVTAAALHAGRDPSEITFVYNVEVRVGERPSEQADIISGSADAVVERLLEFADLGFGAFNLMPVGPGHDEQVELLANQVVPAVRDAAS
jgi:alkanesulfonate monooxygenase SsuD/methylene tetrahydromethanopterin reductase-like flavin-dependent oxidoreductase (luciferase family)